MSGNPIILGTTLAFLAAVAFGVTAPFIQRFGAGLGPFSTAGLLYLGAALGALPVPRRRMARTEAAVRPRHLGRLLAVALFGAALAPSLFAWGLQRVPATHGSLLLSGEAVLTVALAALVYREQVGVHLALAALLMFAGGALTAVAASAGAPGGLWGAVAVVAAVFCWAVDNVLTRPLADLDPAAVVRLKALCGAAITGCLAAVLDEPPPRAAQLAGLLACGATGYGASLRLYLLAQRRIGAGRTGSVYAVAPFIGALVAMLLGDRGAGVMTAAAAMLFAAGLALHLTERHRHAHHHPETEHDHAHTHDDGHHHHGHEMVPAGPHSHPHEHGTFLHAHAHGPDLHHRHSH